MNEVTPITLSGPIIRSVIRMQLKDERGSAVPPRLMSEYGGLLKAPAGSIVQLDIGDANRFFPDYADYIAPALVDAQEIEIFGKWPNAVAEVRAALGPAIARAQRRRAS